MRESVHWLSSALRDDRYGNEYGIGEGFPSWTRLSLHMDARDPQFDANHLSWPILTTMSTTQNKNSTSQLDDTAPDDSNNATNTTMTTEENSRAKIKMLETQLQASQQENTRLKKALKIEAEFREAIRKAYEKLNSPN
ncbi:hypothetical protein KCU81_g169, partial [Aureobasidium melanogenum]